MKITKSTVPVDQQIAFFILDSIRWILFIPAGFAVGSLVAFVGFLLTMVFENKVIAICMATVLPAMFSFCVTAYGANVAPSENKRIPGLVITLLFVVLAGQGVLDKLLNLGNPVAIIFNVIVVLTSLATALRLKPIKGADFLRKDPVAASDANPSIRKELNSDAENVPDLPIESLPASGEEKKSSWKELLGIYVIGLLPSIDKDVPLLLPVSYTVVLFLAAAFAPRFIRFLPLIAFGLSFYFRYTAVL
jgi:hypothetical protein